MAIFERQYSKILAQELLRYLLMGRSPNVEEISNRLSQALSKEGAVTYKYLPQPTKAVFQHKLYNKSLKAIKFDIDTFQEEVLSILEDSLKRVNYADLYHKVHSYELTKLESQLKAILFTLQNADFYFLGAFEDFNDISKTDTDLSTDGIVNLSEGCLALPFGNAVTKRVKSPHLVNAVTWPVEVTTPSPSVIRTSGHVPGSAFGSMFVDTISAWAYEVVTATPGKAQIRFKFPLAGLARDEVEILLNRIELVPHSTGKQTIQIRLSNDDVNYIAPLGYEDGLQLVDQRRVAAMDFETTLVQFVEITLTKESPDAEVPSGNDKAYQYIFGLKSFSALTTGRLAKGVYYSKPFEFTESTGRISKVSIDSKIDQPTGTSVYFSVALADDQGTAQTSFIPIIPVGKKPTSGASEVVTFNQNSDYTFRFQVDATGGPLEATEYGSPFQGKKFYQIGVPLSPKPIYGSAKLYRGYKAWSRDSSGTFETSTVNDAYVSFNVSDNEAIYALTTEVPTYLNDTTDHSCVMTVSQVPYYNASRGHTLRPPASLGTALDLAPLYAVYSVRQVTARRRNDFGFSITSAVTFKLPHLNFLMQSPDAADLPKILSADGSLEYVAGQDYSLETVLVDGVSKPTGTVTLLTGGRLAPGGTPQAGSYLFRCTNDPDITYKVSGIINNQIVLENCAIGTTDSISVQYRFIPVAPNQIIQSSVRVTNLPSTAASPVVYVEGQDYIIDATSGGIQRLPTGSIPSRSSVYVDFTYRNARAGIETFQTWCLIPGQEGVQIRFNLDSATRKNNLIADRSVGESFFVSTSQGLVDLTSAASTPLLGPGWVQFIVRSKNPDANVQYGSNLIDQVIQVRDNLRKRVFKEGSDYFTTIVAFRDPLVQRTLNHLKVNTLRTDHQVFAVDDTGTSGIIVLNFKPGLTTELYTRIASDEAVTDDRPSLFGEIFTINWSSKNELDNLAKLLVKVDLERDSQADGALTPKVHNYSVRVSF